MVLHAWLRFSRPASRSQSGKVQPFGLPSLQRSHKTEGGRARRGRRVEWGINTQPMSVLSTVHLCLQFGILVWQLPFTLTCTKCNSWPLNRVRPLKNILKNRCWHQSQQSDEKNRRFMNDFWPSSHSNKNCSRFFYDGNVFGTAGVSPKFSFGPHVEDSYGNGSDLWWFLLHSITSLMETALAKKCLRPTWPCWCLVRCVSHRYEACRGRYIVVGAALTSGLLRFVVVSGWL